MGILTNAGLKLEFYCIHVFLRVHVFLALESIHANKKKTVFSIAIRKMEDLCDDVPLSVINNEIVAPLASGSCHGF